MLKKLSFQKGKGENPFCFYIGPGYQRFTNLPLTTRWLKWSWSVTISVFLNQRPLQRTPGISWATPGLLGRSLGSSSQLAGGTEGREGDRGGGWVGTFSTGGFAPSRLPDTQERRVRGPAEYLFSTEIQPQTWHLVTGATQTSTSECSHGKGTNFHNIPRKS